jgi:hypothetical protein
VEVSRRRRPSVYSGSTPEIEIVRAGPKEAIGQIGSNRTSLLARLGLRLPPERLGSIVFDISLA